MEQILPIQQRDEYDYEMPFDMGIQEGIRTDEILDKYARYIYRDMLSTHESYPSDHPWVQKLTEHLWKISGDEEYKVVLLEAPFSNGMALSNKTIILSRRFLEEHMTQYDEEIDGFFGHEVPHVNREHFKQIFEEYTGLQDPMRVLGFQRSGEIEADVRAILRMDEVNSNPYGYISLLESLRRKSKTSVNDAVHGTDTDRILTLKDLLNFYDLPSLDLPLTERTMSFESLDEWENDEKKWQRFDELKGDELYLFAGRQIKVLSKAFEKAIQSKEGPTIYKEKLELLINIAGPQIISEYCLEITPDQLSSALYLMFFDGLGLSPEFEGEVNGQPFGIEAFNNSLNSEDKLSEILEIIGNGFFDKLSILKEKDDYENIFGDLLNAYLENDSLIIETQGARIFNEEGFLKVTSRMVEIYRDLNRSLGNYSPDFEFSMNSKLAGMGFRYLIDRKLGGSIVPLAKMLGSTMFFGPDLISHVTGKIIDRHEPGKVTPEQFIFLSMIERLMKQQIESIPSLFERFYYSSRVSFTTDFAYDRNLLKQIWDSNSSVPELVRNLSDWYRSLDSQFGWSQFQVVINRLQLSVLGSIDPKNIKASTKKLAEREYDDSITYDPYGDEYSNEDDDIVYTDDGMVDLSKLDEADTSYKLTVELSERLKKERKHLLGFFAIAVNNQAEFTQILDDNLDFFLPQNRFNLEGYLKFASNLEAFKSIRGNFFGQEDISFDKQEIVNKTNVFRGRLKFLLISELSQSKLSEGFDLINEVVSKYNLLGIEAFGRHFEEKDDDDLDDDEDEFEVSSLLQEKLKYEGWKKRFYKKVSTHHFDTENIQDLETLFQLGIIADVPQVQIQLSRRASQEALRQMTFEEGFGFVFERYSHIPRVAFTEAMDVLTNEKATKKEHFEMLDSQYKEFIQEIFRDKGKLGMAAMADSLSDEYFHSSFRLLDALLRTKTSDKALKVYIAERWYEANARGRGFDSSFNVRKYNYLRDGNATKIQFWINDVVERGSAGFKTLPDIVNSVLLMDQTLTYAMLRKILMGNQGVLQDPKKREKLADLFVKTSIDYQGDEELKGQTEKILNAFVTSGDLDDIYLQINPIIQSLILQPTPNETSYDDVAIRLGEKLYEDLTNPNQSTGAAFTADPTRRDQDISLISHKLRNLMIGEPSMEQRPKIKVDPEMSLLNVLGIEEESKMSKGKLGPWEAGIEIGENSPGGAKGIQFSRLLLDVPQEVQPRMDMSFDQVEGQSRLSQYRIARREGFISEEMGQFMEEVEEFEEGVGGGSLFKVEKVRKVDGSYEAMIVRNPNAIYRTHRTISFYEKVVSKLLEDSPENEGYMLFKFMLGKLNEWVQTELTDTRYYEKNQRFKQNNDHYMREGDKYEIRVPEFFKTGSMWVYRDAFVFGKNLTDLEVIDEGETDVKSGVISKQDYKKAISSLLRNYRHQIETGLCHPDYTPGQIRISEDNATLSIFDRKALIELTKEDISFQQNVEISLASGNISDAVGVFADYVLSFAENAHLKESREVILLRLTDLASHTKGDWTSVLKHTYLSGMEIPLKVLLLLKNILFFQTELKKAGFSNFTEAFFYQ